MIQLDPSELSYSFSRASGKGGQNVNKLNTKATLTWNLFHSKSINYSIKLRFKEKFSNMISDAGQVVITSQKHRTQTLNKGDCLDKLMNYLSKVEFAQKARKATKPTRGSKEKRLKSKKLNGLNKKLRQEKF
ncbi:hypothetical protein A9Q84_13585 [Halobacteriovorax marinus]|uniref:Prokaryotic-type class I peptide chain release factors domain-containing protein n=1 Tax=Halobacteriovorax marinus TaxID=97084 RepID=A0A1Y5FD29_9BACT|nr:hypothetical protein A9Q84_13585 [Halobacteriovorax marinus]